MTSAGEAVAKLLYIAVVEDDDGDLAENETTSFRYTRSVLQSTLQFMGCKARHAFKISQGVFEKMKCEYMAEKVEPEFSEASQKDTVSVSQKVNEANFHAQMDEAGVGRLTIDDDKSRRQPFELYKRRTTVFVGRKHFLDVVCESLSAYKYVGPNQRADLVLACRIRERKESLTVLLCGTSGCGKSTLSALLGGRLGITTVISTDSIRHMMRSFVDEEHNPLLWASTYHAGEHLDPVAVAEAKAKRKAKKTGGVSAAAQPKDQGASSTSLTEKSEGDKSANNMISTKQMAIEGFKAQSEMIIDSLDRLITSWEERKESAVVEGVHLSLNFVMGLMKKHPSIIPFMVYISNEEKHLERFAVRAKYMTLDPARNKYVKYIRNIRRIQEYLCNRADKHLVPKINNTNVDRSVAAIHATVFSCLRRRTAGEHLYDPITNTVPLVNEEYKNQCSANSLSSKGMFQLIQRQDSSRRLMALLNNDGSVAKAWPVDVVDDKGKPVVRLAENGLGNPLYGPLEIGRAESVNLQFGHFGISAWQSDTGGTSHASSVDESKGELTDNGSRYYSSCCSTPRFSDGASKEHMEEQSVHGSDEEDIDEPLEVDSDEDVSDGQRSHGEEELEGSVDEGSKSDEEYYDLAMQDDNQGSGYLSDNEDEFKAETNSQHHFSATNDQPLGVDKSKLQRNLDLLPKRKSEPLSESLMRAFGSPKDKNERKLPSPSSRRLKKRSQSIPASKGNESLVKALTNNEAPPC